MKVKLLKELHKRWRHKIIDGEVMLFDDKNKLAIKYLDINNFMIKHMADYIHSFSLCMNWHCKRINRIKINKQRETYNKHFPK